jgi:hypothetical protein
MMSYIVVWRDNHGKLTSTLINNVNTFRMAIEEYDTLEKAEARADELQVQTNCECEIFGVSI